MSVAKGKKRRQEAVHADAAMKGCVGGWYGFNSEKSRKRHSDKLLPCLQLVRASFCFITFRYR